MKQIALTLILALGCLAETAQAQDAKAAIRQHYAAAKAYVEQQQQVEAGGDFYPVTQCFTVQVKQNLPGTGYHQEDVKLYYREEQDSAEQIYPDLLLDFATKRYNFAARTYYEEYLYDQQGRIEFIYAALPDLDEGKDYELRFYFSKGQLIETIVKCRPMGGSEFETVYQGKTYQRHTATTTRADWVLQKASWICLRPSTPTGNYEVWLLTGKVRKKREPPI